MLDKYKEIFEASEDDRRGLFEEAGNTFGTLSSYAEKDFWVCLTLEILFNHRGEGDPQLLFKGGTSLSKVYELISRFSEDIDITVFSEDLGMDLKEMNGLGSNAKKRFLTKLSEKCDEYLFGPLVGILKDKLHEAGAVGAKIVPADDHTIFVQYPSLFQSETAAYVMPMVKIESGARSATVPHEVKSVQPYVQAVSGFDLDVQNVCTIKAERTFADKMIILHGLRSGFDKEERVPQDRNRASRHYYDLAEMFKTDIADGALGDLGLLEDVRSHAEQMFQAKWRGYDTAVPGQFKLMPYGKLLDVLRADYKAMSGMIFGDVPTFDDVLSAIGTLENKVNS
jgi:hypothetical protein